MIFYSCKNEGNQNEFIKDLPINPKEGYSIDGDVITYSYCHSSKESKKDGFDKVYIKQDIELIKESNRINNQSTKSKKDLLNYANELTTIDIGKELKLNKGRINGNYIKFYISFIDYKGKIIDYQMIYDSYEELFAKEYYNQIKVKTICEFNRTRHSKINEENLNEYRDDYPESFWINLEENIRDRRYEAISYFTYYPASEVDRLEISNNVDWRYWTKAMNHIRYLIINRDIDGLRMIINSSNKEGRIIAAVALDYMEKNEIIKLNNDLKMKIYKTYKEDGTVIITGLDLSHWGKLATKLDIKKEFKRYIKEM